MSTRSHNKPNQKQKAPRAPQHRFRAPIYTRPSCCSVLRSGEQAVEPFEGPALGIFDLAHAKRTKLFIADGTQLLFALTAFIDRLCAALVDDAAVQSSSFLVVCFSLRSAFLADEQQLGSCAAGGVACTPGITQI